MDVWTVIVTHDGGEWIGRCLESVQRSTYSTHIVVVDNGSSDNTVEIVRDQAPDARIIETGCNIGFGVGNNLGISEAIRHGAQYVVLLNQDARLHCDAVRVLVECANENANLGIVSPIHLDYAGERVDPAGREYLASAEGDILSDLFLRRLKSLYIVPFMPAAAWLVRVEALAQVGGFDPLFFMYGEDSDVCIRMRNCGWMIGVATNAIAYHHRRGDASEDRSPARSLSILLLEVKQSNHVFIVALLLVSMDAIFRIALGAYRLSGRQASSWAMALVGLAGRLHRVMKSRRDARSGRAFLYLDSGPRSSAIGGHSVRSI